MKPSEIKKGEIYRCMNGTFRSILFFWSGNVDLAYCVLTKDRKTGRFTRRKWIDGFCSLRHFARYAVSSVKATKAKK